MCFSRHAVKQGAGQETFSYERREPKVNNLLKHFVWKTFKKEREKKIGNPSLCGLGLPEASGRTKMHKIKIEFVQIKIDLGIM